MGYPNIPIHGIGSRIINNNTDIIDIYSEYQKMRKVLTGGGLDLLLGYILLSYCYTLFKNADHTLKHVLFIVGARATRKTSLALCFSLEKSVKYNFTASDSGLQNSFKQHADSIMLIDDLAPASSYTHKQAVEQKLEMLLRLFGDSGKRVINTSFSPHAKDIDYSVRGGAIITGEYFYSTGSESSIARATVLELEKDSVDLNLLTYFQANPDIFESFMYRFLVFISSHWDNLLKLIPTVCKSYRDRYQGFYSNDRYADYLGQHIAIAKILERFFVEDCGVSGTCASSLVNEIECNIINILKDNDRHMKTRSPINTILESILYAVETGRTISWGDPLSNDTTVIDADYAYYIRQKDLPDLVKNYCTKTGEPLAKLTATELGHQLKAHNICTVYEEGNEIRLSKKHTTYKMTRLMELPKAALYKKLGITNNG